MYQQRRTSKAQLTNSKIYNIMEVFVNVKLKGKIEKTTSFKKSHILELDKGFPVSRIRGKISINELIPKTEVGGDEDTFSNECYLLIEGGCYKLKLTIEELIELGLDIGQTVSIDPNKLSRLYEVAHSFDKYYHRYIFSHTIKRNKLIGLLKESC